MLVVTPLNHQVESASESNRDAPVFDTRTQFVASDQSSRGMSRNGVARAGTAFTTILALAVASPSIGQDAYDGEGFDASNTTELTSATSHDSHEARSHEVDKYADQRIELMRRMFDGGPPVELKARISMLESKLLKLAPSCTAQDLDAVEDAFRLIQSAEDLSAEVRSLLAEA